MSADAPLAEFEFRGGALRGSHLVLFPRRLVHHGGDVTESVALAHLGAVRVAFVREARRLRWAVALAVLALACLSLGGPLEAWAAAAAAEVAEHARPEPAGGGVAGVLRAAFRALAALGSFLPVLAMVLVAATAWLATLYWLGRTTLVLTLGAAERAYSVRGRNPALLEFAEALAEAHARALPK